MKVWEDKFGRMIKRDEIVFDFDNRENGFYGINFTGINLASAGYHFEIYYAEGQKSPHIHVKGILGLSDLDKNQLKQYKKLFMKRYAPKEYWEFMDIQLIGNHRIAEENKLHYKYNTIKKLMGAWNKDKQNIFEQALIELAKEKGVIAIKIDPFAVYLKDKIPISSIAKKFGLKVKGNMAVCPFHADKDPSLSLSDEKGLFHCFGCNESGDLITFYKKLKELQNEKKRS